MNEEDRKEFREIFKVLDDRYENLLSHLKEISDNQEDIYEDLGMILEHVNTWKKTDEAIKEVELYNAKVSKKKQKVANRVITDITIDYETDKAYKVKRKEDGLIKWIPKQYISGGVVEFDNGFCELTLTPKGAWILKKPWEQDTSYS